MSHFHIYKKNLQLHSRLSYITEEKHNAYFETSTSLIWISYYRSLQWHNWHYIMCRWRFRNQLSSQTYQIYTDTMNPKRTHEVTERNPKTIFLYNRKKRCFLNTPTRKLFPFKQRPKIYDAVKCLIVDRFGFLTWRLKLMHWFKLPCWILVWTWKCQVLLSLRWHLTLAMKRSVNELSRRPPWLWDLH